MKNNDLVAFTFYGTVKNVYPSEIIVHDVDNDRDFAVKGNELIQTAMSADEFSKEEKKSKGSVAEIMSNAYHRPFTVCFVKQNGEERVLRGRLIKHERLLGRSMVEDLDVTGHRNRQVDHRTIRWLIVDNVKYVVKK